MEKGGYWGMKKKLTPAARKRGSCWVASKCTISRVFTCVFFNSIDMGGLAVNNGMEFDVKTKEFCWN